MDKNLLFRNVFYVAVRRLRLGRFLLALMILSAASPACATCKEGATQSCSVNGNPGTQACYSGQWGACIADPEENPPSSNPTSSGVIQPKYFILAVVYAPPGKEGGGSESLVTYGSGSTAGSTVSATNAFQQDYSVSASAEAGLLGTGVEGSANFSYGQSTSNTQSLEIKKTTSVEITVPGHSNDGIDHDRDQIYLWLNPTLNLQLTEEEALWSVGNETSAHIQYVYVGWLKDPSQMPENVAQRLQDYGITTEDYREMLQADPFANGATTIDPGRYQRDAQHTTFPYMPPFAPNDRSSTLTFTVESSNNASSSSSVQNEYSVGATVSGSTSFLDMVKIKLKNQDTWTWTSTNTNSASGGTSESASVTIGGPSYGYTGPTELWVYYDVIYKTFLFAPVEATRQPALFGLVEDKSGNDVSGKEVIVIADGITYRTFTNSKGEYRIFGDITGSVRLRVDNIWQPRRQIPVEKRLDLVLP